MTCRNLKMFRLIISSVRKLVKIDYFRLFRTFLVDANRFWRYSGRDAMAGGVETSQAHIIVGYHVIEKGLTMPARRYGFGQKILSDLMINIEKFVARYGKVTQQVEHAIAVVHAYRELHINYEFKDVVFKDRLETFCILNPAKAARQLHLTRKEYYSAIHDDFRSFALSRHTLRNYTDQPVSVEDIRSAVKLAQTAPSACNRQHARVKCLSDKEVISEILKLQGGSRGFGHLADKLLVVTGDLRDCLGVHERNDAYINGGIFLMNLCYALHYHRIAHCILSCSLGRAKESDLRSLLPIDDSEVLIALLSIGNAPDEFDVASSPRKPIEDVFLVK